MTVKELWVEAYQGEVLGETLFAALAERETQPDRRHQLGMLAVLERATGELAGPVFDARGWDRGDTDATRATAANIAAQLDLTDWAGFLGSIEPVTLQFLEIYRQLVDLAADDAERDVARAYVDHELALRTFARRALGQEAGDPLAPILELPHVKAAAGAS